MFVSIPVMFINPKFHTFTWFWSLFGICPPPPKKKSKFFSHLILLYLHIFGMGQRRQQVINCHKGVWYSYCCSHVTLLTDWRTVLNFVILACGRTETSKSNRTAERSWDWKWARCWHTQLGSLVEQKKINRNKTQTSYHGNVVLFDLCDWFGIKKKTHACKIKKKYAFIFYVLSLVRPTCPEIGFRTCSWNLTLRCQTMLYDAAGTHVLVWSLQRFEVWLFSGNFCYKLCNKWCKEQEVR